MNKHTKGPWHYHKGAARKVSWDIHAEVNGHDCGTWVANVHGHQTEPDEAEANACLIAAAPDLLEALQAVSCQIHNHKNVEKNSPFLDIAVRRIGESLAKATGHSKS